jgi:two-component system NtrC family sensor kinase
VPEASYRVLVVDDEPLALNLAKRVFQSESDIEVHATTSPVQGLAIAGQHDIDLVIADQRMPELSGLEFLDRLRAVRPRAQRLLLTAYPDMSVALRAINDGLVYRFVLKPWDLDDMRITVRRALEAKRLGDAHEKVVAQLKASHEELVHSEHLAALGRLSAGIGHELSNAVTPILANAGVLEHGVSQFVDVLRAADHAIERGFAREEVERLKAAVRAATEAKTVAVVDNSLRSVKAASMQLSSLVRGVRGYTVPTEPQPFDVNQSVLAAIQLVSHRLKGPMKLERDLRAVPRVRGRGPEITQVALNLIGNAIDAVERMLDPTIQVRTWHEGRFVKLQISDNGLGLDPAIAQRLFQPFASTKGAGRGNGLGLSICRSIVGSHGGTIEASSPPGRGARFTVSLPAIEP